MSDAEFLLIVPLGADPPSHHPPLQPIRGAAAAGDCDRVYG
eukprot:gene20448-24599_t